MNHDAIWILGGTDVNNVSCCFLEVVTLLNRSNFLQLLEALDWKLMHEKDPVNKVRQLQNSGLTFFHS
jgi:hypothetical protein